MSKVSVIVPVLNRKNLVSRCLDSVAGQTRKPDEIIVVDNGSTDGTPQEVEKWIRENEDKIASLALLYENKKGACAARQKGLDNAKGDYLIFFDSDDEMHPDLIEKALKVAQNNSTVDIVCWKSRITLLNGKYKIPPFMPENPLEGHLIHTLLRPQGYMVKKEVIEKAGGWQKDISVWNDFELGLRLLMQNPKIEGINEILSEIYSQAESITGINFSSRQGEWEKTLSEMANVNEKANHPQKKKIDRILNYRKAILAAHYHREGNRQGAVTLLQQATKGKGLFEKSLLNFSYLFTRLGLRGVWRVVRFAY